MPITFKKIDKEDFLEIRKNFLENYKNFKKIVSNKRYKEIVIFIIKLKSNFSKLKE